jgi:hypothetical protein
MQRWVLLVKRSSPSAHRSSSGHPCRRGPYRTRRTLGESPGSSADDGLLTAVDGSESAEGSLAAHARVRSRCSSSRRARIAAKSSAVRGRLTFPSSEIDASLSECHAISIGIWRQYLSEVPGGGAGALRLALISIAISMLAPLAAEFLAQRLCRVLPGT